MAIQAGQQRSLPQHLLQSLSLHSRPATVLAFLFSLFVALAHQSRSQQKDLVFEDVPLEEGTRTNVQCILQDRTGYLWFATWSGLYRYDGYNFVSYRHDPNDTTSLFDNTLTTLFEDNAGVLWIGSYLGVERFDPQSETFNHYTPNPSDSGDTRTNQIWAICEDRDGMLWVGSGNGLYKFDRMTQEFTSFRHDSTNAGSISHNFVSAIFEDSAGSLWFGTGGGLDKLDRRTGRFVRCTPPYWINSLYGDDTGVLWLGTEQGLVKFHPPTGTSSVYRFASSKPRGKGDWGLLWWVTKGGTSSQYHLDPTRFRDRINSICRDPISGSLWFVTSAGLFCFDRNSEALTHYDYQAMCVHSERSGTLWVGTVVDVKKLNRTKLPFRKYPSKEVIFAPSIGNQGRLWLGTLHGFVRFDLKNGQVVPDSFGTGYVFYVWPPYNVGISIRTWKGDIFVHDSLGNVVFTLDSSWKEYIDSVTIGYKGKRGYWVGFISGEVHLWEPKTNRVLRFTNVKERIFWVLEDSFGLVWIATYSGRFFRYDYGRDSLLEFVSKSNDASTISGKQIFHIHEDQKGRLWIATNSGLNRYERVTSSFTRFTERDGLNTNSIHGIADDAHGCLWLSTTKGISRFDPETQQFKNYDVSYGVEPASDVFLCTGSKTRDGEILFGGAKGFTRFHPDSIHDNQFIPPIVITSLRKFDKPIPVSSEVRLPHDENFLSFEFAALSYISPERNQYAYMLEGLDKDWIQSGTRRYASYPGLPPGEYVFRVKGSNNDGVWNEAGTSLVVVVAPPWWKTSWAYGIYAILLLSAAYFTWKLQVRRIRLRHEVEMTRFEAEKLHEVDSMKSRFFANISHEFRTPLTLIMGPAKRMRDTEDDAQKQEELGLIHKNATRLLELVNQLLDLSRLESGSMKLRAAPENVVPLLKGLLHSFCSYAERKRITTVFAPMEDNIIVYVDRDKLQKIVTNLLGNAFKFTPVGGRVELSVAQDPHYVRIRIGDTGIGIPPEKLSRVFDRFYQVDGSHTREQEGSGIGLSLTRELVELHKGTISVESEEGRGSAFTVRLPLGRAHLLAGEICEPEEAEIAVEEKGTALAAAADAPKETRSEEGITPLKDEGKPVLLIVEDNQDVRQYIRRDLEAEYTIVEAVDGEDGWIRSLEQMPDIIISDVMMPKLDGVALCDRLKTDERTSHIPVILLTAKAATQDKIEGYRTGADDYIMKPFEQAELRARLENLLEQRKRLHEHFRKHGLFEIKGEKITSVDQKFLEKAFSIVTERMPDPGFGVETLAQEMAVSQSLLLKKIEALTGEPPVDLIKRTRLNRAAKLIEGGFGNAFQVALEVGFSSPSYFTKCFKKQFGVNPSEYHRSAASPQA